MLLRSKKRGSDFCHISHLYKPESSTSRRTLLLSPVSLGSSPLWRWREGWVLSGLKQSKTGLRGQPKVRLSRNLRRNHKSPPKSRVAFLYNRLVGSQSFLRLESPWRTMWMIRHQGVSWLGGKAGRAGRQLRELQRRATASESNCCCGECLLEKSVVWCSVEASVPDNRHWWKQAQLGFPSGSPSLDHGDHGDCCEALRGNSPGSCIQMKK